jgi:U3 small nucleolar RNA-associated protein 20
MKESKTVSSYESLEILGRLISFSALHKPLLPLKKLIEENSAFEITQKVEVVFRKLSSGIVANIGIDLVDFLVFVFQLLTHDGPLFEGGTVGSEENDCDFEQNFLVQDLKRPKIDAKKLGSHSTDMTVFGEFGLLLLLASLKKGKFDPQNETHRQLLDNVLPALCDCLESTNTKIIGYSLKAICALLPFKLPEYGALSPSLMQRIFGLIQESGNTSKALVQASMKIISFTVRETVDAVKLTENQISYLLLLIRPDLDVLDRQTSSFDLIKSFLTLKISCPELYDVMDEVTKVMVTRYFETNYYPIFIKFTKPKVPNYFF